MNLSETRSIFFSPFRCYLPIASAKCNEAEPTILRILLDKSVARKRVINLDGMVF